MRSCKTQHLLDGFFLVIDLLADGMQEPATDIVCLADELKTCCPGDCCPESVKNKL